MTDDTEGDGPTGHASCKRTLTMKSMSVSLEPLRAMGALTEVKELTPFLSRGEMPLQSRQHSGPYLSLLAWASNYHSEDAGFSDALLPSHGLGHDRQLSYPLLPKVSLRWEMKVLASHLRFGGRIFEAGSHFRQSFGGSFDVAWIDVIKEVTSNAFEVNRPRGPHLGHAPRCELRDITPCVRRAFDLRHKAARFEIVHQASCPARRKVGRAREVRHSQLVIRRFRKVHDHGVLARCQANASDEVAVEESREYLKNSHLGTPKRILVHREWIDVGHSHNFNLLFQATRTPGDADATTESRIRYFNKDGKIGAEHVK